jgi:hypothetical protein
MLLKALREGLRDAGYVEGRNLRLEIRSAAGKPDLQLEKAAECPRRPSRPSAVHVRAGTAFIMTRSLRQKRKACPTCSYQGF